ncbi:hypothetical protein F0562_018805 [Nyssa sinensis]|uniref:Uncharacterized protein n=1 Tax=Nyssa sinensis TaxID=561372 RepID=A0A5J4ZCT0_9ASTE|nr:hypothetical protein F0562_018805 [Nyssa sinensis]
MGATFCCLRQSRSKQQPKRVGSHEDVDQSSSIIDIAKSEILKKEEKRFPSPENRITVVENLTLEQCLTASPGFNPPPCITSGELHVKQLPKRGHVLSSSPRVHSNFCTPRSSFSSDKLWRIDEGDDEDSPFSSRNSTPNGKLKKRV